MLLLRYETVTKERRRRERGESDGSREHFVNEY